MRLDKLGSLFAILAFMFQYQLLPGQKQSRKGKTVLLGTAQINITPLYPVILSGYDARKTPSIGIHDSLFAAALFFSGGAEKALLISADLIGFPHAFADSLKIEINRQTGLAENRIMIIATHNHGGPALHANEDYIRTLKQKLVTVAVNAMNSPQPFLMGMSKTVCTMNINRRAVFADGSVWLGRNPDGTCDHELDLIKFMNPDNVLIAVFVNWPCHGTVSGQENYSITGDWPAAAARHIKRLVGKNIVVAVTAGASANINPIYGPGKDFDEVEAVGYHVAQDAWKTFAQIKMLPVRSMSFDTGILNFPGKKGWKDRYPETSVSSGSMVNIRLSALKLDNIVFCGVSCELMTEMGMQIKKASPYPNTIIITHCNGLSGYICTDKAFIEGGYEPKVSHLMPGIEKVLVQKCMGLIRAL